MIHIIHHNDLDGACSAAIVINHLLAQGADPDDYTAWAADYHRTLPTVKPDDFVYLLDFTPKPAAFKQILEAVGVENVVWIDHHKTNIDAVSDLPRPQGSLSDTYPSASMLTFKHVYQDEDVPEVVQYVDMWDTFTHSNAEAVLNFVWGAKVIGLDSSPNLHWWTVLLEKGIRTDIEKILEHGSTARRFEALEMRARLDSHGFDVRVPFPGGVILKGIALNCGKLNSFAFDSRKDAGYDVFVGFFWNGRQYTVSLYKARDLDNIHLGQFCSHFGGGGHAGAAGFQCAELPEWLRVG